MNNDVHHDAENTPADHRPPTSVTVAQALFLVNAVIWLLLGVLSLARMTRGLTGRTSMMWIVAIPMLPNATVLLWAG